MTKFSKVQNGMQAALLWEMIAIVTVSDLIIVFEVVFNLKFICSLFR